MGEGCDEDALAVRNQRLRQMRQHARLARARRTLNQVGGVGGVSLGEGFGLTVVEALTFGQRDRPLVTGQVHHGP